MGVVWFMNIQHSTNAHSSAPEVILAHAPMGACNVYYCGS